MSTYNITASSAVNKTNKNTRGSSKSQWHVQTSTSFHQNVHTYELSSNNITNTIKEIDNNSVTGTIFSPILSSMHSTISSSSVQIDNVASTQYLIINSNKILNENSSNKNTEIIRSTIIMHTDNGRSDSQVQSTKNTRTHVPSLRIHTSTSSRYYGTPSQQTKYINSKQSTSSDKQTLSGLSTIHATKLAIKTSSSFATSASAHIKTSTLSYITPSMPSYNTPLRRPPHRTSVVTNQYPDCGNVLQQIPAFLNITEHDKDKVMMKLIHGTSINISLDIVFPANIVSVLQKHFRLNLLNNHSTDIILQSAVDIEQIYLDTKTVVNYIEMKITCRSAGNIPVMIKKVNVTVEDIDDNGPVFEKTDVSRCALPVYTAGAGEQFVVGDPVDYQRYFIIDYSTGTVNKTSNITIADPHDFIIIVQATEESSAKRSRVAVLTVSVSLPHKPLKSNPYRANRTVIAVLQIISGVIILGFTIGFIFIVRHRNKKHKIECDKELTKTDDIEDIEEFMVATSTNEVTTCSHPIQLFVPEEPTKLSLKSPDPIQTASRSPVSPRKVKFVLPEKTYRMIYGKKRKTPTSNVMK
ncbi:unnamed protein product [Mytilus edulis]|uniref:Cadherin domain-containing protein n=1 Tax=Mytilus edulis TaxID=6550 RepID=A0A8S3UTU3_MYTED|nr:unnamed protein product [Mytilus edulis]